MVERRLLFLVCANLLMQLCAPVFFVGWVGDCVSLGGTVALENMSFVLIEVEELAWYTE